MDNKHSFLLAWASAVFMAVLSCVFLLLASSVVAHGEVPTPLSPGDHDYRLTMGGYERTYRLHIPAKFEAKSPKMLPVVMMLHGAGGGGVQTEKQTGWDKKADDETFIVVFPDALPSFPRQTASFRSNPRFWNDGSGRGGALHDKIDDIAFLNAVLDDVEKRLPVDTRREFVTGFSSGASMTFLAAAKMNARIAAAAPVSGHFWSKDAGETNERAVPLLLIYGNKDPLNPWEGTKTKPKVLDTVDAWVKWTGCPTKPAPISDKGSVKRLAYGPGKNGAEFLFIIMEGMGHNWPGGKEGLPESVVGPRSDKINATEVIWTFFERHLLAPRAPVAP